MSKKITRKTIQAIADVIAKQFKPEKIILFGSWAWGKPNAESDIDLMIIKKSKKRRIERERERLYDYYGTQMHQSMLSSILQKK